MDEYPSKRVVGGVGFNRKGSSIAVGDNQESRSIKHCNRIGCSTRHSSLRCTRNGNPEKLKLSRPAFLSTSSRETIGSSSRTTSNLNDHGKSSHARRNTSSLQGRVTMESSSRQEQKEYLKSSIKQEEMTKLGMDPSSADVQTPASEAVESSDLQGFITNGDEASSSSSSSSSRHQKPTRKTESSNQGAASSSSVRRSVVPRNTSHSAKPSQKQGANEQKYGLRSLSCTSISDVLPSGSSSGHYNKRTDPLRKRYNDGENSAARGKRSTVSSNRGNTGSSSNGHSVLSLLERPLSQPASITRGQRTSRDGVLSARTRRFASGNNRTGILRHIDDNNYLLPEPLTSLSSSQAQISLGEAATASSSLSFPAYVAPICQHSSGQSGPRSGTTTRRRQIVNSEDTNSRISHDPGIDRDSNQRLNVEGIEEVLLALEQIEQNEELTYEQLMVLQSNLFVGGIGFHDQHRDWRLDIDNMSYEELLALGEKMGTVSTALSEEELSKCLKRSIYTPISELVATCRDDDDDVKCSICQEEYTVDDELGRLHCNHRYHMACIHQWLRQKNWCPICKSSACPS